MTTRRPKPPQNAWLIEQRKRRGWKPEDVATRLDVAVPTVRGWESGRGIGPDSVMRLEAIFGSAAPGHEVKEDSDLAGAIRELTQELQASREEREKTEARLRAVEAELESLRVPRVDAESPERPAPRETTGSGR